MRHERAFARLDYAFYFHQAVFAYGRPPLGARHVVNIRIRWAREKERRALDGGSARFRRNEAKRAAAWLTVTHARRGPVRSLSNFAENIFARVRDPLMSVNQAILGDAWLTRRAPAGRELSGCGVSIKLDGKPIRIRLSLSTVESLGNRM